MTTAAIQTHPHKGSFIPRRWLATFVENGGNYNVERGETPFGFDWQLSVASPTDGGEIPFAKVMLDELAPKNVKAIQSWLFSIADFDPDQWLRDYEANGGFFRLGASDEILTHIRVYGNDKYQQAADMWRELTDDQKLTLVEARLAQAAYFDPLQWVLEFGHRGGTIYGPHDGRIWTAWAEEREEAGLWRSRLIPSEEAELRAYLYRVYELPEPELAA